MRRVLCLAAVLVFLANGRPGHAQVLTGGLTGTVRDQQGLVVVGVQVRVSSPSVIGGPLSTSTDAKGRFRFLALPPGVYAVEMTKPGFAPARTPAIRITTGPPITVDLVLSVDAQADVVEVVAARKAGDSGVGAYFGPGQLRDIPTVRNGMFAFIPMAPGISQTSRSTSFVSALGSGVDQNQFLVDGTNVTATSNGIARSEPGIDFIQEIRVQSIGASAEYGNAQGAVIEIITRQGSDRFQWDGSLYSQPASLTSQPVVGPINGTGTVVSGYERQRYGNFTTTLGGPVVRSRLWFFGGYEYLRDEDSQPYADPAYPKQYRQQKGFGKLTWQIAPGWHLVQSVHYESWDNRELPTGTKLVEATQRLQARVPAITFGNLTHTSGANRVWEASAGRFEFSQDITRSTGDPSVAGRLDRKTGVSSGAPSQVGELQQIRWTGRVAVSQFHADLLGTDHLWKAGGQFDRGEHRSLLVVPTGVRYEDNAPAPTRAFLSGPSNAGGRFVTASAFVTDAFHIGTRISISAGLRFDYARAISPAVSQLDADGHPTGVTIEGKGFLYSWNVLSPRLGLTVSLTADGRTMLRASYGRFTQGVLTGELTGNHPGQASVTAGDIDPVTGALKNPVTTSPSQIVIIDPGTRAPRTDEYSIGLDREIAAPLTLGVAYVHKTGSQFIGWEDSGGTYLKGFQTVHLTTGEDVTVPFHTLTSPPSTRLFNLTNQPRYSLTYDALVVMAEKRLSHGWYAGGSYTWSRAAGLQPSGGTTAAGAQVATVGAPPVSFAPPVTFGRDPNALTNADGRLPNDRPHLVRLTGSIEVPHIGVNIGGSLQYSSGKPWAQTADITSSSGAQGTVRVLLEPRGTRRLPSQTVLDMRVSKALPVGRPGSVELRFDILNALNDTAEESIWSDRYDSPVLGVGNVFLDPRRVMLSVRVNLGK